MIDLHTHSLYSDGELIPAELWRRAQVKGYRYLAITDHVDASNFEVVLPASKPRPTASTGATTGC